MSDFDTAMNLWKRGDHHRAMAMAKAARAADPQRIDVLNLLAELHGALREPDAAVGVLTEVARLDPTDPAALRRLAQAQFNASRYLDSIATYRRAIALEPANVRAHNNLGRALERIGDRSGAAECYRTALALDPNYAIAHNNLGLVLSLSSRSSDALACYRRAVALRPDFGEAWYNCAAALFAARLAGEALACCDRAVALMPEFAEAWFLRGGVLCELQLDGQALVSCERALALRPDYAEALYARANLLRGMGDHRAAAAGFRAAQRINPAYEAARIGSAIAVIPALPRTAGEIEESRAAFDAALTELGDDLQRRPCADATALVGAVQPFYLAYQDRDNRDLLGRYGRICAALMQGWQRGLNLTLPERGRAASSPVRIGIISAQIADHSVYNALTRGWLSRLDRRRFQVDVFRLGGRSDAHTQAARVLAHRFEEGPRSTQEWTRAISDGRFDVLIYPEVGMDQTTLQLAAMRLAKTQIVAWGHPVTSGLPTLDYYLSAAAFEPSNAAQHYTEQLVRLPNLGAFYEPPIHAAIYDRPPPPAGDGDADPILICAGTPFKYSPEHDGVLVDIARRLGRCQFHFFKHRDGALSRRLLHRLSAAFEAAGLDAAAHLVLRPWLTTAEFRDFLGSADLFLDTLGFSGFNTVMQALECGLPVVAWRGRFMRGRLGSGVLERLSLTELVAPSPEGYADIAVALAQNRAARKTIQERIKATLPLAHRDHSAIDALQGFLLRVT